MDAVKSIVDCFQGQPNESSRFTIDRGKRVIHRQINAEDYETGKFYSDEGYNNSRIKLGDSELLANIQAVQGRTGLPVSKKLEGKYNLTVEMETGTGKTYTYIRTMYDLYKAYGWSKYIVVVPSVAIREGVYKSFQMTEDHFMAEYGMKARVFVYNSKQLHQLDTFASDASINVMIINSQAFSARGKDARRIYMELDDFQSRRPIDVIASTNPIVIIDEPQSVEGKKTKEALQLFNPLFTLRYSATHREDFNKVYRLDALDAYNKKLVKKINVKGIDIKGTTGTESYLYLEGIDVSNKHAPIARLEFEVRQKSGLAKKVRKIHVNDDLYQLSGRLEQYKGFKVSEIDGRNNRLHFANGVTLDAGDVQGDVNEQHFRRIQIRETIKSHFRKERELFAQGIKVLSLFFIDEVANYRQYDADGQEQNGLYADMFVEEYMTLLEEQLAICKDEKYKRYLKGIQVHETHKGYFSVDKKSKRLVDPKVRGRKTESDDVDAYDLIMKDKERLLSFREPTRFIFSHSALKEGWDNPNVFQICTLKQSDSTIKKRQEVGRGLRLCVNQEGERVDATVPGIDVHEINRLTVVASESYEQFAQDLQSEIAETLSERPQKVDQNFFLGKVLEAPNGDQLRIDEDWASKFNYAFIRHGYVNEEGHLTDDYFADAAAGNLKLSEELASFQQSIVKLVETVYVADKVSLTENERGKNIRDLQPNDNFYKREFQELWRKINKQTVYTVRFDSEELIKKCIETLDKELRVPQLRVKIAHGALEKIDSKEQLKQGEGFKILRTKTGMVDSVVNTRVTYDLIGKLMDETKLTRKTIVHILTGIKEATFRQFRINPEEFILRVAKLINEQKAATIIESITYDVLGDTFTTDVFTQNTLQGELGENAVSVDKHIFDYVVTDSHTEQSFAKALDTSTEVSVYAKLPRGFFIPTPVGNYNPDWAIVFKEGVVKHIYFIAETKGTMESLELRGVEEAKVACARKHFQRLNTDELHYGVVSSYEELMDIVIA